MDLTGRLWVAYGQVTDRLQVAYRQVTDGLWAGYSGSWAGQWWVMILWAGHRQWGIIGNLKFKAYFELL